jgi:hypothetical protein
VEISNGKHSPQKLCSTITLRPTYPGSLLEENSKGSSPVTFSIASLLVDHDLFQLQTSLTFNGLHSLTQVFPSFFMSGAVVLVPFQKAPQELAQSWGPLLNQPKCWWNRCFLAHITHFCRIPIRKPIEANFSFYKFPCEKCRFGEWSKILEEIYRIIRQRTEV